MSTTQTIDAIAIVKSETAPTNTDVLWEDTTITSDNIIDKIKIYDLNAGEWKIFGDLTTDAAAITTLITEQIAAQGVGEANTASNVGTSGLGLFKQKNGNDLQFYNLNITGDATATVNSGTSSIDIAVTAGGIDNVVEDTTPQLGGNFDLNNFVIYNAGVQGQIDLSSGGIIMSTDSGVLSTPYASLSATDIDLNGQGINGARVQLESGKTTISHDTLIDLVSPTVKFNGNLDAQGSNIIDLGDMTFQTGATGGTIRTGTSNADKWLLQAYDVDDSVYVDVARADAGNDPLFTLYDESLRIADTADTTKLIELELDGITTGTTRTLTIQDVSGIVALQTSATLIPSRALFSDANGKLETSVVTATELSRLSGVTSSIQTQLNNKLENIVEDTTPQFGGNVDAQTFNITNLGTLNTHTIPGGTGTFALTSDLDGNGIYDGNGTIPSSTVATVTDRLTFAMDSTVDEVVFLGSGTAVTPSSNAIASFQNTGGAGLSCAIEIVSESTSGVSDIHFGNEVSTTQGRISYRNQLSQLRMTAKGEAGTTLGVAENANVSINGSPHIVIGSSAVGVLGWGSGTAPTTSPADSAQMWVADHNGAGTAAFHTLNEEGDTIILFKGAALTAKDANTVNSGDPTTNDVIDNNRKRIEEIEDRLQANGLLT